MDKIESTVDYIVSFVEDNPVNAHDFHIAMGLLDNMLITNRFDEVNSILKILKNKYISQCVDNMVVPLTILTISNGFDSDERSCLIKKLKEDLAKNGKSENEIISLFCGLD